MAKKTLRVALNPRNPEAASWYDPATGVNLFLGEVKDQKGNPVSGPISGDLSSFSDSQLRNVVKGINSGLLIVAEGELPEGVNLKTMPAFRAPRSRWAVADPKSEEAVALAAEQDKVLASWDQLVIAAEARETGKTKQVAS